jgi:CDP-diacylglycerol--glycerol-3-phosphate 3-phosphatidyltransferase
MANLMTLSRLILLLLVVWIAYLPPSAWQYANFLLIITIFITDGLDGYIARKRNEETLFGALFDIAGDRIVELTLWIVFADLGLVPIWVPIVFVIRGTVVDTIRSSRSQAAGDSPFEMMQTPLGKWLVAGKFMRILYAVVKAVAFCVLALILPSAQVIPQIWGDINLYFNGLAAFLVYFSVILCLARGLPVVAEFINTQKPTFTPGGKP